MELIWISLWVQTVYLYNRVLYASQMLWMLLLDCRRDYTLVLCYTIYRMLLTVLMWLHFNLNSSRIIHMLYPLYPAETAMDYSKYWISQIYSAISYKMVPDQIQVSIPWSFIASYFVLWAVYFSSKTNDLIHIIVLAGDFNFENRYLCV